MIKHAYINFLVPIIAIQEEVKSLNTGWKSHFNTSDYLGEWNVIALRSPGGKIETIIPDLMNHGSYENTILMDQCPGIKQIVSQLQCDVLSVRLLNLKAGAVIKEHRDRELAFEKGEARLHFPIFTNSRLEFYVDNERLVMDEGTCWYINANLPHRVSNNGSTDRIHLVIDCKVNTWLQTLFSKAVKTECFEEEKNPYAKQVIEQLRLMNTPTAIEMANKMEQDLISANGK